MRILAVDDDPDVLQALVAALSTLPGHEIRSAAGGNEAYHAALSEGDAPDLLVTDVVMEPVDGLSLRNELLAHFPGLRTVFISGYDLSSYAEAIGSAPLVAKPLDLEALRAAVESELAQVPAIPAPPEELPAPEVPPAAVEEPVTPLEEPVVPVEVPRVVAASAGAVPVARAVPVAPRAVSAAPTAVPAAPRAVPAAPRAVPAAPQAAPAVPRAVAVPRATAVPARPAAPTAVPPPKATAAPSATVRAAVPVPKATAVPRPAAPPQPTAVPKATAVPQPTAVPRATAAPQPTAVPKATAVPSAAAPSAVPVARPAVPKATAAPQPAVPRATAVPRPTAAPRAVPSATAVPRATAPPPPAAPLPPASPSASVSSGIALELLGKTIGGYQITSLLGEGRWGPAFLAVQVAINRPVGLKLLDPAHAADPEQKERFIADARAKASVQHPSILAVYEAGSADGWIFYTQEYVDGRNLADLASTGEKIDQPTALRVLRAAAEAAIYFERNTSPHTPLTADSIYLGADGHPRLSNPATQHSDQQTTTADEIEQLGRAVLALLPMGPEITVGLRTVLGRTQRTHPSALNNWGALLQAVKALEPKVVPVEAARISAQDRAAVEAVEKARQQQKRAFLINVGAMVSLLLIAAFVGWYVFIRSNERRLTAQVHIPAGDFVSGTGVPSTNEEFWIDKYEVTLGQYARFVQWINANPNDEHQFDHKQQPRGKSHIPQYWEIYYGNAEQGKAAHSVPISLNSPVMMVTWWDAYAYAKWKGRELPTALEWERAARGTKGFKYPWGEEPDVKRANTNADFSPRNPGASGPIDGFNFWGDVDRQKDDKSPDGVIGMCGNVSEWTASWTKGNKSPIIKGGNFTMPLRTLDEEISDKAPDFADEYVGFRTISHTAPPK